MPRKAKKKKIATSEKESLKASDRFNITSMYTTFLSRPVWWGLLIVLTVVGFFLTQTKIKTWQALPFQRLSLDAFIEEICQSNDFNPQTYWQFRESYSPGHFVPNPEIAQGSALVVLNKITPPQTLLLTYYSNEIRSQESLVAPQSLSDYLTSQAITPQTELCRTPSLVLYQTPQKQLRLIFLAPLAALQKTNGFINYTPAELSIIGNQIWVSDSLITPPAQWKGI